MPRMLAWEIIEVSAPGYGTVTDPFLAFGFDPNGLNSPSDSHGSLWIELKYIGHDGREHEFIGWEATFDWNLVETLVQKHDYDNDPALGGIKLNMIKLGIGANFEMSGE